ncbi:MAG: hypothetical protein H6841_07810 [Planctomycetes bacterium]|nr:hypothetical protein [Planctomycetota bacterium]MCB9935500.1 hypothetical protein [Planctomycetota bacterium]
MSLLAWPALLLLTAAAVLVALAAWSRGAKQREVGTLLIWRRVAQQVTAPQRKRREFDPLFWLLLAAVAVGSIAASRPAWFRAAPHARVAVFLESTGPGEPLELEDARARGQAAAPDAELTFFTAGHEITPGSLRAELAQFETRTRDYDGRILLLNQPSDEASLVLPRVTKAREGVMFKLTGDRRELLVQASAGGEVQLQGASRASSSTREGVTTLRFKPTALELVLTDAGGLRVYRRKPFVVGTGESWNTDTHAALLQALESDAAEGEPPAVWLGSAEQKPAVRLNTGAPAEVSGASLSFDPQHPLFRDLPLQHYDWLAGGRLLAPEEGVQPLLTAVVDGVPVGDLARLRDGGRVLEFAGDPFSASAVADAALLLDNAIGVVAGVRPSERPGYELAEGEPLPSRRQATAAPFESRGKLDLSRRGAEPVEFAGWLMVITGLLLAVAAVLAGRGKALRGFDGS